MIPGAKIQQICMTEYSVRFVTDKGTWLIEPRVMDAGEKNGNAYAIIEIRDES